MASEIIQRCNTNSGQSQIDLVLNNNADNITNKLFNIEEINKAIGKVDPNKSSAIENIRSNVIIDAFNHNIDRVLKMYNISLVQSTFPDAWKTSTVMPLPMVNNKKHAAELRPI